MIKRFILGLAVFVALLVSAPANAACAGGTCFGIAAGNWNTSGTWATSTGGASCACTPATGDAVVLDANSGAGTYTVNAVFSLVTFVSTGFTGTLAGNSALTISGNTFTLGSGMTITYSGGITFTSTSGTTAITSAGQVLQGAVTFNGVGGTFQLQDAFNASLNSVTLTNGTFNANNFNVTAGNFASSNSNVRTVTMGSGLWTLDAGAVTVWTFSNSTNLTFNKNTANLSVTGTSGAITLNGGGKTYNDLTVGASNAQGGFALLGANTFAHLNVSPSRFLIFPSGVTTTIQNAFTWTGTSLATGRFVLRSDDTNTGQATISVASGSPTMSFAILTGMAFTGGATFTATNAIDEGNNSGITITAPSSGGGSTGHIIGTPFKSLTPCIEWIEPRTKPAANDNTCVEAQAA